MIAKKDYNILVVDDSTTNVVLLEAVFFERGYKIETALKLYEENHQMTNLIETIYKFIPNSLKTLGENPLKSLYFQLSKGIHEFKDEECLDKAEAIDTVLKFTIKQINLEKSDIKSVKDSLNKLK